MNLRQAAAGKPSSPERGQLETIWYHFKNEFPLDPVTPLGRFFAKRSCAECLGRGLLTWLKPEEGPAIADLGWCACARIRRDRFVTKALLFAQTRERGGLAFAEGTVCLASELALPTNPAMEAAAALERAANDVGG